MVRRDGGMSKCVRNRGFYQVRVHEQRKELAVALLYALVPNLLRGVLREP